MPDAHTQTDERVCVKNELSSSTSDVESSSPALPSTPPPPPRRSPCWRDCVEGALGTILFSFLFWSFLRQHGLLR